VKAEIQDLKEKLTLARETIDIFKTTLTDAQQKKAASGQNNMTTPVKQDPVASSSKASS
jgi:hypothetical protein